MAILIRLPTIFPESNIIFVIKLNNGKDISVIDKKNQFLYLTKLDMFYH